MLGGTRTWLYAERVERVPKTNDQVIIAMNQILQTDSFLDRVGESYEQCEIAPSSVAGVRPPTVDP